MCRITGFEVALGLACVLALTGCSQAPSGVGNDPAQADGTRSADVRTLRGLPSPQTPRLADLGDVGLLGEDSTMREALVGGDAEVVVAATMLGSGDMYSLDIIVLNRRDRVVQVQRSDLQVVDANGRWLEPVARWEQGDRVGLSARRSDRTAPAVVYELDRERELAQSRLLQNLDQDWGSTAPKRTTPPRSTLKPTHRDAIERAAQPELAEASGSPVRVTVPPEDGGAFWGYFRGVDAAFPLTAVVLVEGEQILFRFDR